MKNSNIAKLPSGQLQASATEYVRLVTQIELEPLSNRNQN